MIGLKSRDKRDSVRMYFRKYSRFFATHILGPFILLLSLSGCASLNLDELAEAFEIETPQENQKTVKDNTPIGTRNVAVPRPPRVMGPDVNKARVPSDVRQQSASKITPAMQRMATVLLKRLNREMSGVRNPDERVKKARAYQFTKEEKESASVLGFKSISIDVTVGGNSPYVVGGALSQGIAFSLLFDKKKPRWITGGGFNIGVPNSYGADLQISFWKSDVNNLNGWLMGVNVEVPTIKIKNVSVAAGAFWSVGLIPQAQFQGFSIGLAAGHSPIEASVDAGFVWAAYTSKVGEVAEDGKWLLTTGKTRYGAEIGESCNVGTDCKGYTSPVGRSDTGNACCAGVCATTKKDWAGINYCPAACVGKPFGKKGTCK